MRNNKTFMIAVIGMGMAMTFVATRFISIPLVPPLGYFNLGDAVIIMVAVIFGKEAGALAGGIGSALADISFPGYAFFAPITLVVKGIEGYVVGLIASKRGLKSWVPFVVGPIIMIAGYFLAEALILKLFMPEYGFTVAIAELPINTTQGAANGIISILLIKILHKSGAIYSINPLLKEEK